MSISMYDFQKLHHSAFREEIKKVFSDIVDSNVFVEGEYNAMFEKEFAKKQGAKHCLLVANGTDALEIALVALDIGPGDEVGVPGITFFATAEAVLNVGAKPVFIDVDPTTSLMCPTSLKEVLQTRKLKAIMPVHIYGMPAPIAELEPICSKYGVHIIEDAAQAQGGYYQHNKAPVGSSGHMVTFSFYPTKNLSAFGDAGAITTNDDMLVKKITSLRNHGRGDLNILGRNSRCDHLQAAVLYVKLKEIDAFNQSRKEKARYYHNNLKNVAGLQLLPEKFIELSSWHLYPIRLESAAKRMALGEQLKAQGVTTIPYYEQAITQMIPLKNYPGPRQNAENWAGKVLCLPVGPHLTQADQEMIVKAIKTQA